MNKLERKLKQNAKYKKRLKNYNLDANGSFNVYKSHGKPCSCYVCSTNKYKHNGDKKKELKELKFQLYI